MAVSLRIRMGGTNASLRMGIYADVGGQPGALLAASAYQPVGINFNLFDIPDTYLPSGDYWIAWRSSDAAVPVVLGETTGGTSIFSPNADFPDPYNLTGASIGPYRFSVNAVMCPAGASPTPTPFLTATPTGTATPTPTPTPGATCAGLFGELFDNINPNLGDTGTIASDFILTESGSVTAISLNTIGPVSLKVGLYSDNASPSRPLSLLVQGGPVTTAAGWNTLGVGPTALAPGRYWIAVKILPGNTLTSVRSYDLSPGNLSFCNCDMPTAWANLFTTNTYHLSMRAHYSCP
jgi:hypothetical protein